MNAVHPALWTHESCSPTMRWMCECRSPTVSCDMFIKHEYCKPTAWTLACCSPTVWWTHDCCSSPVSWLLLYKIPLFSISPLLINKKTEKSGQESKTNYQSVWIGMRKITLTLMLKMMTDATIRSSCDQQNGVIGSAVDRRWPTYWALNPQAFSTRPTVNIYLK